MKATIQDIAQELDVSISTVSRSLRQDPSIHPRTRARVAEAAMKLGYEGRQQRGSRSDTGKKTIGILLAAGDSSIAAMHENSVRMLQGITEECDRNGMAVTLHTISTPRMGHMATDEEFVPHSVREHTCEALILVGPQHASDVAYLAKQVPTVSLSWRYPGVAQDIVLVDNVEGIARQVEKLVAAGHRRLAWVPQQYEASFFEARYAGFIQGCLSQGLDPMAQRILRPGPQEQLSPIDAVELKQLTDDGVTAFVCANDSIAFLIVAALASLGLRVPEDISVTGFDAMSQQTVAGKTLDSIDPHFADMGRDAVRLALRRLQNPTARTVSLTVDASIIDGGTIAPPPGAG